MKIPRTFIPEKNLEDKTHDFLRNEDFRNESYHKEYPDVEVSLNKHVINGGISAHSSSSYINAEASDELKIIYHKEKILITIIVPIFKEMYHRELNSGSHTRAHKKLNHITEKAKKSLERSEKNFDFTGLMVKVQSDYDFYQEIERIFKFYPSGERTFKFRDDGYTENHLFYEEAHVMYNLYHKCLSKYVQKYNYNIRKGFLGIF